MPMLGTYLNAIADDGNPITHLGLVDETGAELSGGDPAYARKAVSWTDAGDGADNDGTIRPTANHEFDIPPGATVGGWRGYSAGAGGTNFGGEDLDNEEFNNQGVYTLLAAQTAIHHTAGA